MAKQTGYLWAVIQEWLDSNWNPPSQNKLAARLETSASALSDYKYAVHMPPPAFLERLASELQVPYERVLDAALRDRGYRRNDMKDVMGNADRAATIKVPGVGPAQQPTMDDVDDIAAALDRADHAKRRTRPARTKDEMQQMDQQAARDNDDDAAGA